MAEARLDSVKIKQEQIAIVYRQLPLLLFLEVLGSVFFFAFILFSTSNYTAFAYVWFALLWLAAAGRYLADRLFVRSWPARIRYVYLSAVISSLIWGTTWLIMPTDSLEAPRGILILWPCAMAATAAATFAIRRSLFFSFLLPLFILQNLALLPMWEAGALRYLIGMDMFYAFIALLALRVHRDLNESLCLKLENEGLQVSLKADQQRLQQQSEELLERIQNEQALLSAKHRADSQLQQANEEKLLLLDAAGEGIFGTNNHGRVTFMNQAGLQLLGHKEHEVLGQDALNLICQKEHQSGSEAARTRQAILDCLQHGRSADSVGGLFTTRSGNILPVNFSCRPLVKRGEFIGAVVSFFDMTSQVAMEERLVQAEKMEAIGRITGGIAHDFNNLLTVIQGNLRFLKKSLGRTHQEGEIALVDKVISASQRGAELNNRLLSYSREQTLQPSPLRLNHVLTDMQEFLLRALGEDIDFALELDEHDKLVMVDRHELENVILNLCVNARDAMPEGGRLTMRSESVSFAPGEAQAAGLLAGDYVELQITDTGSGISPDIQNKIFDPFFTTKRHGLGSGFGLSTAFGFMQQSGGKISVQSIPGDGATFKLYLPVTEQQAPASDAPRQETPDTGHYSGTVLLVEDDEDVREIACLALTEAGFNVISADHGQAGLACFSQHPEIDLVFSDVVMPGGMTGIEMARQILRQRPDMPVLLATGYTEKVLKDQLEADSGIECISKPYEFETLFPLMQSMMQKKSGREDNEGRELATGKKSGSVIQ